MTQLPLPIEHPLPKEIALAQLRQLRDWYAQRITQTQGARK